MGKKNAHCSFCGQAFAEGQPWPRVCAACGQTSYQNPFPVSVVLLPVDGGLLVVRRGILPQVGKLALPGGFINLGESWQAAGARELSEETQIEIPASDISLFDVLSAPDGTVLIFGLARPRALAELAAFAPSQEATERTVLSAPTELAFPLHTEVVRRYFARSAAAV